MAELPPGMPKQWAKGLQNFFFEKSVENYVSGRNQVSAMKVWTINYEMPWLIDMQSWTALII